jgi:hypothetical protein
MAGGGLDHLVQHLAGAVRVADGRSMRPRSAASVAARRGVVFEAGPPSSSRMHGRTCRAEHVARATDLAEHYAVLSASTA